MTMMPPDLEWYLGKSKALNLSPRCPFASVHKCPRYYQSLSLLGGAGSTSIPPKQDNKLLKKWQKSENWPLTGEQATSISYSNNQPKQYSNFCPEVSYERFKLFASNLSSYSDELDLENAHKELAKNKAGKNDWRWYWWYIQSTHYSECPLYSVLLQENGNAVKEDIIELKPNFVGFGINLRALWRKIKNFQF